uniref:Uncharacterized protein n=1 Tax=Anopheles culicifacies TaxID=139723 RepID=A0A182LRN1_9DIPT
MDNATTRNIRKHGNGSSCRATTVPRSVRLAWANRTLNVATSLVSCARSPEFRSTSFSSLSSRFWFSFWTRLCDSYNRSYLSCQAMMLSSSSTCRSLSCRQALSIASSCECLSASALFNTSISAASCTSQFCRTETAETVEKRRERVSRKL